jgi:uncharacterized protein (TIGR02611 family)
VTTPDDVREEEQLSVAVRRGPGAWRHTLRGNRTTRTAYRLTVFVVGLLIVILGLILVPLPGPGWLIVIGGIAVWASEFERAHAVLSFVRKRLEEWNDWIQAQPLWVRGAVALATLALVLAFFWAYFSLLGVPGYLPDPAERLLNMVTI